MPLQAQELLGKKGGGNMEHRSNKRFPAGMNIGIEYPGGKTVFGNSRDVTLVASLSNSARLTCHHTP